MSSVTVPVQHPTPHADYTQKYNHQLILNQQRHHDAQVAIKHFHEKNLLKLQEQRRIEKNRDNKQIADNIHLYNIRKSHHDYNDYRYLFYIGTRIDTYI
jgi:hypothetical protein